MVRGGTLILVFLPVFASAQDLDFSEATKLSSQVNSRYEEGMPLISPDGTTLYFTRSFCPLNTGGQYTGSDVWVSHFDRNVNDWAAADNQSFMYNSKGTNAVIGISTDGEILYFSNTRSGRRATGIFFSKRMGSTWSEPNFIPLGPLQTNEYLGLYVSAGSDVIILSMKGADSRGEEDLYVSLKNQEGAWSVPKNLGPSINTSGFEISPFLSSDNNRLFFASNGHGGLGDADIYYCDRLYDSWETWSVPKNLGPKVNSAKFDAYFSIHNDSVAFFTSNRGGDLSDIYSIKVEDKSAKPGEMERRILTPEEILAISGQEFDQTLYFDENVTYLNDSQIGQVSTIARIFSEKIEIKLHLVAHRDAESTSLEIYQQRLFNILDQLRSKGIHGSRMTIGVEIDEGKPAPDKQKIEILLYR